MSEQCQIDELLFKIRNLGMVGNDRQCSSHAQQIKTN